MGFCSTFKCCSESTHLIDNDLSLKVDEDE
jgi:hypothetical protein